MSCLPVSPSSHIVIAGAGHAGGRAALALRDAGFAGTVTLIGAEQHPPYERPPLSKALLESGAPVHSAYLKPEDAYETAGVDLRLGVRVEAIDRDKRRLSTAWGDVAYDRLLLTMGARARRLPDEGGAAGRVLYLRDLEDAERLRERLAAAHSVVVIGAGLIGLEVAAAAQTRGKRVTVLEVGATPLGRVCPQEIGEWFAAQHRSRGVRLLTGARLERLEAGPGESVSLTLDGGERLAADLVVVGIGSVPNDGLAVAAGLAVDDGVATDAFGATNDPCIFAAGDVARSFNPLLGRAIRLETWRNAQDQPVAVAQAMLGGNVPYAELPWFWTDQFGMSLQVSGLPARCERLVWRGGPDERRFIAFGLEDGRLVSAYALNNARELRHATLMIRRGARPDVDVLSDPNASLAAMAASKEAMA